MKREKQEKLLAIFLIMVLVAVVVPMIMIAYYNFRSVDDYSFANMSERVWRETHSVIRTLWGQVISSIELWDTWQGIYFGDWVMLSANAFWSRDAYYMSIYITLVPMIVCQLITGYVIFVKGLGTTIWQMFLVCIPCIVLQILLTPSPTEGYYWMCGAVAYTTTYAISMVVLAVLLCFIRQDGSSSFRKSFLMEVVVFSLTFMMGGSNYVNAVFMLLVYVFMTIWCFYYRKRNGVCMAVNTVWFIACFAFNVFSPGTVARQSSQGGSMPALQAILLSFREAAIYIKTWTFLPVLLVMALMIPVFWRIAARKKYSYSFPLLVSSISFCVFAAHFTPCLYAMWNIGPFRVQNIYRFQLFILLFGNELYWIGWIHNWWIHKNKEDIVQALSKEQSGEKKKKVFLFPVGVMATGVVGMVLFQYYLGNHMPPVSALLSIRSGEAQAFYNQNQERLKVLEDETVKEVYLDPYEIRPFLLYFGDVTPNADSWENVALAEYFGKEKIVLNVSE